MFFTFGKDYKMKAVIYARQSSGREEESASIDMQVEACMGLARRRGYEVVATYADYNTSGRLYPDTPDAHKLAECDIVMKKWHKEHTTEKRPHRRFVKKSRSAITKNNLSLEFV